MDGIRLLRLAGVQVESRNLDVDGNLRRADKQVAAAAVRGAQLVLCPELLAAGYLYDPSIWEVAEPQGGATEAWLAEMARQHRLYIGATYLEASGEDFFNTFTLIKPDGRVAGRVRKESLPGFEGWFFRSCSGPKVIETELGRIGVGICHDTSTAQFLRAMSDADVDLLLMPHSAPRILLGPLTLVGDAGEQLLREVSGFYSQAFGIPTVMANKAAGCESTSPIPWVPLARFRFRFLGQSTICDSDGSVRDRLDGGEGVVIADVRLDGARKRRPTHLPSGYWSRSAPFLHRFPQTSAGLFRGLEECGRVAYELSGSRRRAARKCGRSHPRSSIATYPRCGGPT